MSTTSIADDIILLLKDPTESTRKFLGLINIIKLQDTKSIFKKKLSFIIPTVYS